MTPLHPSVYQPIEGNRDSPTIPATARVDPFDLVIFGGNGDLALRKLLPALVYRFAEGHIPEGSSLISTFRRGSREEYLNMARQSCHVALTDCCTKLATNPDSLWESFCSILTVVQLDVNQETHLGWDELSAQLGNGSAHKPRVFYFAMASSLFSVICARLSQNGLVNPSSRVVLEKPIGHDGPSAQALNAQILQHFNENQIYRIDHYLGKEAVQNLMVLRFSNTLFEAVWNRSYIDHIQISVSETIGVEKRGQYFDSYGILRDMVQNHLLQLVCLTAMEPPSAFTADSVRDEKLKVLRALRPIGHQDVRHNVVLGQYDKGIIQSQAVPSYTEDISAPSSTETFAALRLWIDNWRWAKVPFYIRTGKRLPMRASEIVIVFKPVPHVLFDHQSTSRDSNRLVIRLQPDEGLHLHQQTKSPGPGGIRLQDAALNLSFGHRFAERFPDAYERLIMDTVRGNQTLFMRSDEITAAWNWLDPLRASLFGDQNQLTNPHLYTAGSWGPPGAVTLLARDSREWFDPHPASTTD